MPAPPFCGSPEGAPTAAAPAQPQRERARTRLTALSAALTCTAFGGALLAQPFSAHAQVAGGVTLSSDYRVRGVSMSGLRPALTLSLTDDLKNGVYLGGALIVQDSPESQLRISGHLEYLGYAKRLDNGLTWEAGLDNQHYEGYGPRAFRLDYSEAYFGFSRGQFSTRLYYSPNYGGSGHNVAYLEGNAAFRPADRWRIAAHAGVFEPLNSWGAVKKRPRYDGRVDVIRSFGRAEVSLGWAAATPPVRPDEKRSDSGAILAASVFF